MSAEHQYVAWFRDPQLPVDDQDHEWPACLLVLAPSEEQACSWADAVARDYATRTGQVFLRSYLDRDRWPAGSAPRLVAGEPWQDEDIGW
jgi:hypothetical protein